MTVDLSDLGPLYHDYSVFGAKNKQELGPLKLNQLDKEPVLTKYILMALDGNPGASFVELFCADAFFAMLALKLGASSATGIDNNGDEHSYVTQEIANRLSLDGFYFLCSDVNDIHELDKVDVVANIGGLYHVPNPKEILNKSYEMAKKYLIVQSVVSIATDDPDYFVSPAPNWKWGNRYSRQSFDKMIKSFGWDIVESDFNQLKGNRKLHSRGSVYYLIKK